MGDDLATRVPLARLDAAVHGGARGLWAVTGLLAPHAHTLTRTLSVWVTAVLAPFSLALIAAVAEEVEWWSVMPPLVIALSFLALAAASWLNPSLAHQAGRPPYCASSLSAGSERLGVASLA
jgi:hypothetical protein